MNYVDRNPSLVSWRFILLDVDGHLQYYMSMQGRFVLPSRISVYMYPLNVLRIVSCSQTDSEVFFLNKRDV